MLDTESIFSSSDDSNRLKESLRELEDDFAQLDRAVNRHTESITRALEKLIGKRGVTINRQSPLEKLAIPLLNQTISGVLGALGRSTSPFDPPSVNNTMNIPTQDASFSRMSRGQMLAEAAAAIARASKRYL